MAIQNKMFILYTAYSDYSKIKAINDADIAKDANETNAGRAKVRPSQTRTEQLLRFECTNVRATRVPLFIFSYNLFIYLFFFLCTNIKIVFSL